MFKLTIDRATAAPIILAAHKAGLLPAQNGLSGTYYAEVDGKVVRCAIGALFTPEEAKILEGEGPCASYQMAGELIIADKLVVPQEEQDWFILVQTRHDNWADLDADEESRPVAEQEFLELLS